MHHVEDEDLSSDAELEDAGALPLFSGSFFWLPGFARVYLQSSPTHLVGAALRYCFFTRRIHL
jgi:hypothetical protein